METRNIQKTFIGILLNPRNVMQIGCGNFPYLNFRPLSMTTWQQVPTFKWMVQHGTKVGACAKGLKWFLACGILLEMRQHRQIRPNTIAYDSDPWPPKQESWMCNNYIIIYLDIYVHIWISDICVEIGKVMAQFPSCLEAARLVTNLFGA